MNRARSWGIVGVVLVGVLGSGSAAWAGDEIRELHVVEGGGRKLLVAVSDNGVAFIDPFKREVYRAWPSKPVAVKGGGSQDFFVLRDVDGDGVVDVIVAGKPSFMISGAGDPISSVKGACDQVHIADFTADKSQDVLCKKGNALTVTSHDGQKLWEFKITGLTVSTCQFGDINGDLKADIECAVGKGRYMRVSGAGAEMGRDFEEAQLDGGADDNPGHAERMAGFLAGNTTFDLNADGTAEESVLFEGRSVQIRSRARPKPLATHEVGTLASGLAEDIDGDGAANLILGGNGEVLFIEKDGKIGARVVANPNKLKREASARVEGVGANGLESDEGARKAIEDALGKIAGCYSANVKKDPYTRVGRMIYNLDVDDKGKVKKTERLHSDIDDKAVEGCIAKVFSGLKLPNGKQPGASVTVNLQMGFVDR